MYDKIIVEKPFAFSLWQRDVRKQWSIPPARARLEVYPPLNTPSSRVPAVIIFPGGGYGVTSFHEGCCIARNLSHKGFYAAVCMYQVAPARYPMPLFDGCRAVRIIRSMSDYLMIEKDVIVALGFSAGGHVAGLVSTEHVVNSPPEDDLSSEWSSRPNLLGLVYPLISMTKDIHKISVLNFLGKSYEPKVAESLSIENRVQPDTPQSFIVHALNDQIVSVKHSFRFIQACIKQNLYPEVHILPDGGHGFGLNMPSKNNFDWLSSFVNWIKKMMNGQLK